MILKDDETTLCLEEFPEVSPFGENMTSPACETDECLMTHVDGE